MVAAGLQHAIASRFTPGKRGVASPAGQGAAAAATGAQHTLSSMSNVAASKDRISMILNRSKELLLLKRQTELQVLASLSAANGQGPVASLANLPNDQRKLLGVAGDAEKPLLTPSSDANSDVELLGIARAPHLPGAPTHPAPPADTGALGVPGAPVLPEGAVRAASGKRQSFDVSNAGARGGSAAATLAAGKRQRKTASPKTTDPMTASMTAADMGVPGAGGSLAASAVAAAVKQKSIIDFFTSKNRAAATGTGAMKQPLLLGGPRGQGSPRPGGVPTAALNPWGAKQASDTESD